MRADGCCISLPLTLMTGIRGTRDAHKHAHTLLLKRSSMHASIHPLGNTPHTGFNSHLMICLILEPTDQLDTTHSFTTQPQLKGSLRESCHAMLCFALLCYVMLRRWMIHSVWFWKASTDSSKLCQGNKQTTSFSVSHANCFLLFVLLFRCIVWRK